MHRHCRFITLTYSREELADDAELDYSDLQLWLKRMRRKFGRFRFFAVGEYGSKGGRGHWHLITFGLKLAYGRCHPSLGEVEGDRGRLWTSLYDVGSVTPQSIAYVAAYCTKNLTDPRRAICQMSRRPGIGLDFFTTAAMQMAKGPPLLGWPVRYMVNNTWYPVIGGALEHFKAVYYDSGGCPPASLSPDERDLKALLFLHHEGTRIEFERLRKIESIQDGSDKHALTQASAIQKSKHSLSKVSDQSHIGPGARASVGSS